MGCAGVLLLIVTVLNLVFEGPMHVTVICGLLAFIGFLGWLFKAGDGTALLDAFWDLDIIFHILRCIVEAFTGSDN